MDEEIEVKVDIPEEKHIEMNVEESLGFGLIHDAEKLNEVFLLIQIDLNLYFLDIFIF